MKRNMVIFTVTTKACIGSKCTLGRLAGGCGLDSAGSG
jgi:hypothetical protein